MAADDERWNHNIHYHRLLLAAVPAGCKDALDVGCGEGMLTRALADRVDQVTGIDPDEASIAQARSQVGERRIDYVLGDFLDHRFADESFGVVVSAAALHHMGARAALIRMRALLRAGGVLAVLGLARSDSVRDLPYELAGAVSCRVHRLYHQHWEHPSPTVWPPPHSYRQMRRLAAELLPGSRFRRLALWRYSIVWTKPPG